MMFTWIVAASSETPLQLLNREIVTCRRCPRLVAFREAIGDVKRRAFLQDKYWSKPLTGFGDERARVAVMGLAPAAHGGNRTGRVFTGDRSADFLMRALFLNGFANQPESVWAQDGLVLHDCYLTLPVRCAPPGNKPTNEEFDNCRPYLEADLASLTQLRVVVVLGALALRSYLNVLRRQGFLHSFGKFPFSHGAQYSTHAGGPLLLVSYHPSQQNTFTGVLTESMLSEIFVVARQFAES